MAKDAMIKEYQEKVMSEQEKRINRTILKAEEEKKLEEQRLSKVCENMNSIYDKKKKSLQLLGQVQRDHIDHRGRLEEINRKKQRDQQEQRKNLNIGMQKRKEQAMNNQKYQDEENEKRKEIRQLHKLDQQEAFQRGKNFHMMYKQKLAERILEKASRVPPKTNQV